MDDKDKKPEHKSADLTKALDDALKTVKDFKTKTKGIGEKAAPPPKRAK